jgi:hypothetical protein
MMHWGYRSTHHTCVSRSTCPHPEQTLDRILETKGWQVIVVSRKQGASEEKFFVPPCRSVQLRGIRKLQAFVAEELQMSLQQLIGPIPQR